MTAELDAFAGVYGFALDDFQTAGIKALLAGRSTLVAAPTGAGKTVVGEFAVWQALRQGGKCFYTTPIKALSNQKFNDLMARHGPDAVGLLTGDNVVNGDAPVVVMTTEVLRNMLYEGSSALRGLQSVVLDEVHYLADRERGAVWEEVIIQLPADVQLACLSATVSNAEEFGEWLGRVRASAPRSPAGDREASGACDVVISERRPVPLEHHYAVNDRIHSVFSSGGKKAGSSDSAMARSEAARQALSGVPNPELLMLERNAGKSNRVSRRGRYQPSGVRLRPPRRSDIVGELRRRKWLPAIYFLFSRAGCDAAVEQLMTDGVRLTTDDEQGRIRDLVDERTAELPTEDLEVLGYGSWAAALERGVAAHHAGLVPVFKETVEALFVRNLVKVCFATETLALGINMPARTVVIERLEKWNGQRHELLTPGQFTQLTGRAGRRGLDPRGHAVVLYQRDIDFVTVASLVGRRTEPLRSSFVPSYNMAVNLLRSRDRADAESLLARSFAQYQTDQRVAGEERRIAQNREALAGYAEHNLHSEVGDFAEYWALRREQSQLESAGARDRRHLRGEAVVAALGRLLEGDVVMLPRGGGKPAMAAIVGTSRSSSGTPLASVVTLDGRLRRLGPREFDDPPGKVGWVRLPPAGNPRQDRYRRAVVDQLRGVEVPAAAPSPRKVRPDPDTTARLEQVRTAVRAHPVHHDPGLADLERWARRSDDLRADTERLERSVRRRTGSLVREFDRILDVLGDLGYLAGPADHPSPTAAGAVLAGLYAETDLVLAESLRRGCLDDLDAPDLAAVVSAFSHENRLKEPPPVRWPSAAVRDAITSVAVVWQEVAKREEDAALPTTRPPDPGIADVVWRWAAGADLEDALGGSELTAGDFVRGVKQVADLLRQLRDVAPGAVADTAHAAARAIVRGVVAYSGV
ncbi:MAG: DEAD/DEAH box helicase [Actinomycetota bacterium]|nr:DEAD/DEAH box helicase [Actinomycetota bacterium]